MLSRFLFGRVAAVLLLSAITAMLGGCKLWIHTLNGNQQLLVSADKLAVAVPDSAQNKEMVTLGQSTTSNDPAKLEFLGRVVMDSEAKCQTFINGLVIAENTVNTTGDITSTVLSGLASVFKPLTTVHGLTAGATVVTGSKSAINANIYAKASVTNFQTALQQSYGQAIKDYTDALPHLTNVVVSNEVSKIEAIHGTCTLASTETTILAKINTAAQAPAKPTGLMAAALNQGAALNWTVVPLATSYDIFQGTASGGEGSTPIATGITGTSYTAGNLTNGTPYFFQVAAENAGGTSPRSDEATVTPGGAGPVAVPTPQPPTQTHAPVPGKQ